jgi:hypothetical protein
MNYNKYELMIINKQGLELKIVTNIKSRRLGFGFDIMYEDNFKTLTIDLTLDLWFVSWWLMLDADITSD